MEALIIFGAEYLVIIMVIIALMFLLFQPHQRQHEIAGLVLWSLPIIYLFNKLASALYSNPRPFIVGHFMPLVPSMLDNGFPSGHTLVCATIAAVVYPYNKPLSVFLWVLTVIIGISRVVAGVHHSIDIVGSIVIAGVGVGVVNHFHRKQWINLNSNAS